MQEVLGPQARAAMSSRGRWLQGHVIFVLFYNMIHDKYITYHNARILVKLSVLYSVTHHIRLSIYGSGIVWDRSGGCTAKKVSYL